MKQCQAWDYLEFTGSLGKTAAVHSSEVYCSCWVGMIGVATQKFDRVSDYALLGCTSQLGYPPRSVWRFLGTGISV